MSIGSNTSLQAQYKELVIAKNFTALSKLIKDNENFPPAENVVRLGYKTYLHEAGGNKVKLFFLMKLKEITSIKPDGAILKDACEIALNMDSPQVVEALVNRTGAARDVFRDLSALLQKKYKQYIAEGRFMDIAKLLEITGQFPDESGVQEGYMMYLEEAKFISFSGLKKRTGVKPDPDMVAQVYNSYYSSYLQARGQSEEQGDMWMDRLRKLKRITKVKPPEGIDIEPPKPDPEEDPTA